MVLSVVDAALSLCSIDHGLAFSTWSAQLLLAGPVAQLLFGLLLREAVLLLDPSKQLVAVPFQLLEVVVGELAPARLHLALELLPVTFDLMPVHIYLRVF